MPTNSSNEPGTPSPDQTESQLQALVESYIEHLRTGESPDRHELMARHLDVVREAAQRLAVVEAVFGLGHTMLETKPQPAQAATAQPERRYELGDVLGKGQSAIVYKARDTVLGRNVALKVFRADQADDPELAQRFQQDARIAAGLHHPGIVPVHDYGIEDGRPFLVMDLIEGETLEDRLRAGASAFSLREAAELVRSIAEALHYAHGQGVIHRDVKPSNILLRDCLERLGSCKTAA